MSSLAETDCRKVSARQPMPSVQAFRGVACLTVLMFHLAEYEYLVPTGWRALGFMRWFGFAGVDMFFVLSGYLIARTRRAESGDPTATIHFYIRRAWRILPPYWLFLVLIAIPVMSLFGVSPAVTPVNVFNAVTILPADQSKLWVPQAWTLAFEMAFYLAFGALLLVPRRWAVGLLVAWMGIWCGHMIAGQPWQGTWLRLWLSPFVLEFFLGMVLAVVGSRVPSSWMIPIILIASIWLVTGFVATRDRHPMTVDQNTLARVIKYGPPSALILLVCILRDRMGRSVSSWLVRCGDASYALYLTHLIVLLAGFFITNKLGWSHLRAPHVAWLVMLMTAMLGFGFAFYRWVERPLLTRMPDPTRLRIRSMTTFQWLTRRSLIPR